jgi:ABC-type dipeptide/oligopeptide/nickel transport system permease component
MIFSLTPPAFIRYTHLNTLDAILNLNGWVLLDALRHLILPVITISVINVAFIMRLMRSSMLEVLSQEYIKTARIKGLGEFLVVTRHALRNALVPTVTVIGLTYGLLLEGSVLTETIFSWPGLGRYMANAFLTLDLNTVVGGTMFVALTFCLVNLVVDLAEGNAGKVGGNQKSGRSLADGLIAVRSGINQKQLGKAHQGAHMFGPVQDVGFTLPDGGQRHPGPRSV